MTDEQKPATVTMEALKDGSYGGMAFEAGDTIEVEEQYVETLELAGLAARQDRKERAAKDRAARKKPAGPEPS